MPSRKIIQGGTIVSPEGILEADLIIEGEKVAGVIANAAPGPDEEVIDAGGLFVLPGVVDAHTHIQLDTGIYQTADNWEVGTKAAAAGGVTTVIDFATQFPGQTVDEALDDRLKETEPAIIDYGLHCMITDLPHGEEEAMLGRLVARGAPSFKVYTTYRPNYYMDDATLLRLMRATREVGGLVVVHAENDAIVTDATERLVAEGKTGWKYHAQGRPVEAEWEAVNRVVYLAGVVDAPLYVVHCTSPASILCVADARAEGQLAYCETCAQYLILDDSVYEGPHPEHFILQPPLRPAAHGEGLWELLGLPFEAIDVISTDSCDYTIAQKTEHKEFTQTPGGLPGIETLLPLIYTYGVCDDEIDFDLPNLVQKLCSNPARIFGLYPGKGALNIGSDADVVLYDPEPEGEISHENLHYLAGYSPYEGMPVRGRVVMTLSRGEVVYRYGVEDVFAGAKPGRGQFVPGDPFDASLVP
jgi:dihydropyrimidinase